MLGQLKSEHRNVEVIGAGASGLFSAYALTRAGYQVVLSESQPRVGGMIQTTRGAYGLSEAAANSLVWTPELQTLCDDVGVRLIDLDPKATGKYILRHGRPSKFPLGVRSIIEMAWKACTAKAQTSNPDVASWARLHLGNEAADYLIEAMVSGIYASPANVLSVNLAFPRLQISQGQTLLQAMWAKRGAEKTKRRVVAPEQGMESLFAKLGAYLQSERRVVLNLNKNTLTLPQCENVILATSSSAAAVLLEKSYPNIAALLRRIEYAPLVSVSVFVKKADLAYIPSGLGVLIPPKENLKALGILYSSSSFPNRVTNDDDMLFTILLGGLNRPDVVALSDDQLKDAATDVLRQIFGLRALPLEAALHRWSHAIPVYSNQLAEIIVSLRQALIATPGLVLTGSYTGDVSLRGMLNNAMHLR